MTALVDGWKALLRPSASEEVLRPAGRMYETPQNTVRHTRWR